MQGQSFIGVGLALGVAVGAALGIAMGSVAVGIGLGVAAGVGAGFAIDAGRRKNGSGPENSTPLDGRDKHDSGSSGDGDGGGD